MLLERKGNADDVFSMVARKQFHAKDGVPSMALEGANSLMRAAAQGTLQKEVYKLLIVTRKMKLLVVSTK